MKRPLLSKVILFSFILITNSWAESSQLYVGVWQRETGSNILTGPRSFSAFTDIGNELTSQGLRLVDVEVFQSPGGPRYVGVWRSGTGSNLVVQPLGKVKFREKRMELLNQGLRLTDIQLVKIQNFIRFVGVWRNGTGEERITPLMTRAAFLSRGAHLTQQEGLRLVDFHTISHRGVRLYFGVWRTGSGTNLITEPLSFSEFKTRRDEMNTRRLRLLSLDVYLKNGNVVYEGVWGLGGGENKVTAPRPFPEFKKLGNQLTQDGWRLTEIALVHEDIEEAPAPGGGSGISPVSFPPNPPYVNLDTGQHLIIDFSLTHDGKPEMTIPIRNLPVLPRSNNKIIFPNNFCGMRIIAAERFLWLQGNKVKEEFPFNNVIPESNSVHKEFGPEPFFDGIDFTGPIGACESGSGRWAFPFPLTQDANHPSLGDLDNIQLVFELSADSRIEFLNFNIKPTKALDARELFNDDYMKRFQDILKFWNELAVGEESFCQIETWVQTACEIPDHIGGFPLMCFVLQDSPC